MRVGEAQELAGRGGSELPLFGVPVAVKDNVDVAGLSTTAACPAYAYMPKTRSSRFRARAVHR